MMEGKAKKVLKITFHLSLFLIFFIITLLKGFNDSDDSSTEEMTDFSKGETFPFQ